MDNRPIGVFDSGLGGLTAVKQLEQVLPGESLVYFGDTGRVPYGSRGKETILRYARQDMDFPPRPEREGGAGRLRHGELRGPQRGGGPLRALHRRHRAQRPGRPPPPRKNGKIGVIGTAATIAQRLLPQRAAAPQPQAGGVSPRPAPCSSPWWSAGLWPPRTR